MPVPPPNHPLACRVVSAHTGATIADVKSVIGRGEVNNVCIVTTGDGAKFVIRSHERTELARYRKGGMGDNARCGGRCSRRARARVGPDRRARLDAPAVAARNARR